jgi:hypothetical protein
VFRSGSASDRGNTREGEFYELFQSVRSFQHCPSLQFTTFITYSSSSNELFLYPRIRYLVLLLLSSSQPRGALCNHVDGREAVDSCAAKDIHQMVSQQKLLHYDRLILLYRLNNKLKVRNLAISDLTKDLSDGVSLYLHGSIRRALIFWVRSISSIYWKSSETSPSVDMPPNQSYASRNSKMSTKD